LHGESISAGRREVNDDNKNSKARGAAQYRRAREIMKEEVI